MRIFTLLLFLLAPVRAQDDAASDAALKEETGRVAMVRDAIPKTVLVEIKYLERAMPMGSGAIVSADGVIATCAHVVEARAMLGLGDDAQFTVVTSDGKRRAAKLLGRNSANDIALLKIEAEKLAFFDISEDRRPPRGGLVTALGYPMGNLGSTSPATEGETVLLHPSVALGRVTEPDRKFVVQVGGEFKVYPDCIESDVPIFHGNSGGPLVDDRGRLVGLNAAMAPPEKSLTLSLASIRRCYEALKSGRDVEGERFDDWDKVKEIGKALWDAFVSGSDRPERPWLKEPFAKVAAARRAGVLPVYRGKTLIGWATVLTTDGRLAVSSLALDRKGLGRKMVEAIDKSVEGDEALEKFWKDAKALFGGADPVEVVLPSGKRAPLRVMKASEKFALVLAKVDPGDEKLKAIKSGKDALEPGRWVAVIGPDTVGILSAGSHAVESSMKTPTSFAEWMEGFEAKPRGFSNVMLFDARLAETDLGAAVCDSRGRLVGIAIYHPSRGTSYAAPIAEVRKDLGADEE